MLHGTHQRKVLGWIVNTLRLSIYLPRFPLGTILDLFLKSKRQTCPCHWRYLLRVLWSLADTINGVSGLLYHLQLFIPV